MSNLWHWTIQGRGCGTALWLVPSQVGYYKGAGTAAGMPIQQNWHYKTSWGLWNQFPLLVHFHHFPQVTHWGRVTHTCISKLTIIGSDNDLLPGRYQAIIWTNAGILLNGPLASTFCEILCKIYIFSFKKMHLKMSSGNWQPFCFGLNVLMKHYVPVIHHNWCHIASENLVQQQAMTWNNHCLWSLRHI